MMRTIEAVVFLALACGFAFKSAHYALDFHFTPISELPQLRRSAYSFLATVTGLVSTLMLLRLAVTL